MAEFFYNVLNMSRKSKFKILSNYTNLNLAGTKICQFFMRIKNKFHIFIEIFFTNIFIEIENLFNLK